MAASNSNSTTQSITVHVSSPEPPGLELVPILEALLPVTFELVAGEVGESANLITFEAGLGHVNRSEHATQLRLTLPAATKPDATSLVETEINFAEAPLVPHPFRGRKLRIRIPETPVLSPTSGETVLASQPAGPVWTVSTSGTLRHIRSSFPLPTLAADGMLQQVLNAERFLELLPVLEFLHEACADFMFPRPPLRACFMFDDPNLHWPRYGFVDYKNIVSRATKENYHVSFATVPLDGWFTHPGAARLFRDHSDRLSLLVHGNEHTHHELARDYALERRRALLRQAICRIEHLERASGCRVSRVMAAPHGACSEAMLQEMAGCGFESAAISHGSLRAHNKGKPWTRSLGYLPSEIVQACPVLPRWGMTGNTLNTILLAAYLGQPIILRGHHADLRGGAELLDELSRIINGLGDVRWSNMTDLSRMNYQLELKRETVRVRPGGVNLNVHLPREAKQLIVEPPAHAWQDWICAGAGPHAIRVAPGKPLEIPEGCRRVMLIAVITSVLNTTNGAGLPVWPFMRRLLVEGRDRFQGMTGKSGRSAPLKTT